MLKCALVSRILKLRRLALSSWNYYCADKYRSFMTKHQSCQQCSHMFLCLQQSGYIFFQLDEFFGSLFADILKIFSISNIQCYSVYCVMNCNYVAGLFHDAGQCIMVIKYANRANVIHLKNKLLSMVIPAGYEGSDIAEKK